MNYAPAGSPDPRELPRYLAQELHRIGVSIKDNAVTVFYRTSVETISLSAATSANYKASLTANILRVSTSDTLTLTGITDRTPYRERIFMNIGTGVLVLKSEATESSASNRFLLPVTNWNLSANGTATIWFDPFSSRHRGISRT